MNKCRILNFNRITHTVVAVYNNEQIQFVTDRDETGREEYIQKTETGYEITDSPVPVQKTAKKSRENRVCNTVVGEQDVSAIGD